MRHEPLCSRRDAGPQGQVVAANSLLKLSPGLKRLVGAILEPSDPNSRPSEGAGLNSSPKTSRARSLQHTCVSRPAAQLQAVIFRSTCSACILKTRAHAQQQLHPGLSLGRRQKRRTVEGIKSRSCQARAAAPRGKQVTKRDEATASPRASAAGAAVATTARATTAPAPCRARGRGRGRATANHEKAGTATTAAASPATRRSSLTRSQNSAAWRARPSSSGV